MIDLVTQMRLCQLSAPKKAASDRAPVNKGKSAAPATYRPIMAGKGWMTMRQIAELVGKDKGAVRIAMKDQLIPRGCVEVRTVESPQPICYEYLWIGD